MGLIPGLAQWVKDLALLQLQSRLKLGSDPWPGRSICCGAAKNEKKKKKKKKKALKDNKDGIRTCFICYMIL